MRVLHYSQQPTILDRGRQECRRRIVGALVGRARVLWSRATEAAGVGGPHCMVDRAEVGVVRRCKNLEGGGGGGGGG